MSHQLTISGAMAKASELSSSSSPSLDVELLLCHVLDCERVYLRTWPEKQLTQEQCSRFHLLLSKRIEGRPIAHLTGVKEFWNLCLKVNSHTLIPRPDTEVLVEKVLELSLDERDCSVLDLGTGTGAIALAIANERPKWKVLGVDRFDEVIKLANENAVSNSLDCVRFLVSDWFSALKGQSFDLIVSNPPYIDEDDVHLSEGDVRFEPVSALVADDQGMSDIKLISSTAKSYLAIDGWLMFEHGFEQGELVRCVLTDAGYQNVETFKDYGGNDRVTQAQWLG